MIRRRRGGRDRLRAGRAVLQGRRDPARCACSANGRSRSAADLNTVLGVGMFGGIPICRSTSRWSTAKPHRVGLLLLPLVIGHHDRLDLIRADDRAHRQVQGLPPDRRRLLIAALAWLSLEVEADTSVVDSACRHGPARRRTRLQHAAADPGGAERRPPRDIGVATSTFTFFRQMGGTLGTAVSCRSCSRGSAPRSRSRSARRRSRARRRRSRRPRCSRPAQTASWPTPARSTPSRRSSCPSGSASRTRWIWCSSSPPPSWPSASSSSGSCRSWSCATSRASRPCSRGRPKPSTAVVPEVGGQPAGAGGGRLGSHVDGPAVGHAGGPAPRPGTQHHD